MCCEGQDFLIPFSVLFMFNVKKGLVNGAKARW